METINTDPKTFEDYSQLIEALYTPSMLGLSPGKARINRPGKRAHYTETASQLEAWARPYWGIIPLTLGYHKDQKALPQWLSQAWEVYRVGITNGTDPNHPEYWGKARDFDQRFVEMAAIALAILLCPQESLRDLSKETKLHIARWFDQGLDHDIPRNNWRYFRIFALLSVLSMAEGDSLDYPQERKEQILVRIAEDLKLLESCYLGDGWYSDGLTLQRDYYVSFAMHYYPLVLHGLKKTWVQLASYQELLAPPLEQAMPRALDFASSFRWWFDAKGRAIPFGRSMTYRFAQAGFWSVLATQEDLPVSTRIAAFQYAHGNICWWMKQPIFHPDGTLSIGYRYENHTMAESYNSFGGPYWAFKGFWFLASGSQAPWWNTQESQDPFEVLGERNSGTTLQPHAFCLLKRERLIGGESHAWMLSAGQDTHFFPGNTPEKYAKYAYSSLFGFGVSSDRRGITHTSSDNTTLITDDGLYWRSREKTGNHRYGEDYLISTWSLWKNQTQLETRLEFTPKGYRRIHTLTTQKPIGLIEGGFPLPWIEDQDRHLGPLEANLESFLDGVSVSSSIACKSDAQGFPFLIDSKELTEDLGVPKESLGGQILPLPASSHVLFEKAVVPGVVLYFPPGKHEFITSVAFSLGT